MTLEYDKAKLRQLVGEATKKPQLEERLLKKSTRRSVLLVVWPSDFDIVDALEQIETDHLHDFILRRIQAIENIYEERRKIQPPIRQLVLNEGFTADFANMFERLTNPNIPSKDDFLMAHFGVDWNTDQIAEFVDLMDMLVFGFIQAKGLQKRFNFEMTSETRFIQLHKLTRPSSSEIFLRWIFNHPIFHEVMGSLISEALLSILIKLKPQYSPIAIRRNRQKYDVIIKPGEIETAIPIRDVIGSAEANNIARYPTEDKVVEEIIQQIGSKFIDNKSYSGFTVNQLVTWGNEYIARQMGEE